MQVHGQVGIQQLADGSVASLRQGKGGELIVAPLLPKYAEATIRGNSFYACNAAAQAVSVALATTYTGLCLSNPVGNGKLVVLTKVGLALSVAPAAIAPLGLITGYSAGADVTHTTPLVPASALIGGGTGPSAKADSAATISTPVWTMMLDGGFTAAALPSTSPSLIDIEGGIVLKPGGFVAIGALTAVTGIWSMHWIEVTA